MVCRPALDSFFCVKTRQDDGFPQGRGFFGRRKERVPVRIRTPTMNLYRDTGASKVDFRESSDWTGT